MITLNCVGETCPIPVIKTKNALLELPQDELLTTVVDNIEAVENIEKFLKDKGYGYKVENDKSTFKIIISRDKEITYTTPVSQEKNGMTIVISSDKMGEGSDELGATLLRTFIYTLTESDNLPECIIFYNKGVYLTASDTDTIDNLKILKEKGVDILSCGACLNFFDLTKQLAVGRVSNMFEIVSKMQNAIKIIKP